MIMNMSMKFQMVLPNDLASQVRALADRRGIPLAQLIRETMEAKLLESNLQTSRPGILSRLTGLGAAVPETNLSSLVDQELYGGDPHS